jgi:hypothetical protein
MKIPYLCYRLAALFFILSLTACSTEMAYNTGQAWQRNQCEQMVDQTMRQQCLDKLNMPYDVYKKQTETPQDKVAQ